MGLSIFGLGRIGLGRTCLGGPGSLGPGSPSRFNDCLFRFALSLARLNESLSGSVHSVQRWPSLPQLKQRPHWSALSAIVITAT